MANREQVLEKFNAVPFVNEGLFDCLDEVYSAKERNKNVRPDDELENACPFRHEVSRKVRDFFDGTSNTVMVSELLSGQVDDFGPGDIRGVWAFAFIGGDYEHHQNPNSSAPDELRPEFCSNSDLRFNDPHPCTVVGSFQGDPDVLQRCVARNKHPGAPIVFTSTGLSSFKEILSICRRGRRCRPLTGARSFP